MRSLISTSSKSVYINTAIIVYWGLEIFLLWNIIKKEQLHIKTSETQIVGTP
jgi:hypothetical protein